MSPADRKKVLIAAGIVILALIVVVFVVKGRKKKGGGRAGGFGDTTQVAQTAGTEAGQAAGAAGQPAPAPGGAAGSEAQAGAEAEAAAPTAPMLGVVKMGRGSEVRTRDDPFVTFDPPPQPVPVELVVNPPPVALQDGGLRPVGGIIDVADLGIGMNRVSGLLFNEGAYAILESGRGEAFVVKPGDVVQGHRITAIARDSIYLTDPDSRRWRVPLRSKDPGGAPAARISTTIRGMPETPLGGL